MQKGNTMKPAQFETQEPIAYFNPQVKGGFYWAKPTKITAPITVSIEPMPLYTTPPQRKPLTLDWEPIQEFWRNNSNIDWDELESAITAAAHGIKE